MKFLIYPEAYDEMLLEDPWECPLCRDESKLPANGLLHPRLDWKKKFIEMFRTASNPVSNDPVVSNKRNERSIRVLSLFDGLSTGKIFIHTIHLYLTYNIDNLK